MGDLGDGQVFRPPGNSAANSCAEHESVHAARYATHDKCVLSLVGKGVFVLREAITNSGVLRFVLI